MTDDERADPAELIRQLGSEDSERIIEAARASAKRGVYEAVPALLGVLDSTNDPRVWNRVAISLADMRVSEAKAHIIALLKDPKTVKSRGSLLYALQVGFDYCDELPMLMEMSVTGNFEVRGEAANMLVALAPDLSDELCDEVTSTLRTAAVTLSDELREDLYEVIEDFEAAAASAHTGAL